MDSAQHSLNDLRGIVVPPPPSLWPPAPGVWLRLGILGAATLILGRYLCLRWKRDGYRRAGLALLESAQTVYDVSVVLKRVALAVFPREQVASLHGADWLAFLNSRCSRSHFEPVDSPMVAESEAGQDFVRRARVWIRHHRVAEHRTQGRGL